MEISGQRFKIEDTFDTPITVPDCLVVRKNKIGTGNGEAKLYISSKDKMREFYGGRGFNARCFLLKEDLLAYLKAIRPEYTSPSQNYHAKNEMRELWKERWRKVSRLEDVIEFNIQDQTQIVGPRGYVKSTDEGYNIIRELSLPLVSYISTMQLSDGWGRQIYYWKLFADFDAISDKHDATVLKYGKTRDTDEPKETKKTILLKQARIGQGEYRDRLLAECPFCPITMINDERLLVASHIKPWAVSNDKERIDPKNGFILSPLFDKLFDRGFMTFTDDRHVLISNWLSPANKRRIGIKDGTFIQMLPIDEERKKYLEFHRLIVFKG